MRLSCLESLHWLRAEYLLSNVLGMTAPLTNVVPEDTFGIHFAIILNMPLVIPKWAMVAFASVALISPNSKLQVCCRRGHDSHGPGGKHVTHAGHQCKGPADCVRFRCLPAAGCRSLIILIEGSTESLYLHLCVDPAAI